MSSDDVYVIDSSEEGGGMSGDSYNSPEESFSSSESSGLPPTQEHARPTAMAARNASPQTSSGNACLPLPRVSSSTMTDDGMQESFQEKLDKSLAYMQVAISACLDCPTPDEFLSQHASSCKNLEEQHQQLTSLFKRMRETSIPSAVNKSTVPEKSKRLRVEEESLALLRKPSWLVELTHVVGQLADTPPQTNCNGEDSTSNNPSLDTNTTVRYLLQPPPVVHIRSVPLSVSSNPSSFPDAPVSKSSNSIPETKARATEERTPCPNCAELEVVLKKENADSILPIYTELWRLRRERRRFASKNVEQATQNQVAQEHLFKQMKEQLEKELKFHHDAFLRDCTTQDGSRPSMQDLQKRIEELQSFRKQLDSIRLSTVKPAVVNTGAESSVSTNKMEMPLTSSSLKLELDAMKSNNATLTAELLAQKRDAESWKLQYDAARAKLLQSGTRERGFGSLEEMRVLESRVDFFRNVVRVLGWEVEQTSLPETVVLVHSATKNRKEVGLKASTVNGEVVPAPSLTLAHDLLTLASQMGTNVSHAQPSPQQVPSAVDSLPSSASMALPPSTSSATTFFQPSGPEGCVEVNAVSAVPKVSTPQPGAPATELQSAPLAEAVNKDREASSRATALGNEDPAAVVSAPISSAQKIAVSPLADKEEREVLPSRMPDDGNNVQQAEYQEVVDPFLHFTTPASGKEEAPLTSGVGLPTEGEGVLVAEGNEFLSPEPEPESSEPQEVKEVDSVVA